MKIFLSGLCTLITLQVFGQYIPDNTITAKQYGNTLNSPFTGGISAAQFSDIDINNDGINDLFIFDRGGWNAVIMVKDAAGNFTYAPQYNSIIPPLEDWALVRDYNCDNIPDIFTYYIGSTRVYIGVITDGNLSFELAKNQLVYDDATGTTALYTSRTDIPGIDDIDGDGDLDVLSFSVSNTTIRYYKNISAESGFGCDSLIFDLTEFCWGLIYEGFSCYGGDLHIACKGSPEVAESGSERLHIGSTIVTMDYDGDGDHDALLGDNSCNNFVYYRNGGDASYAEMDFKDTLWQQNGVEFNMPVFPAAFLIDADNDGDKDMLATTNDAALGLNTENVWLYQNLNTADTFDLVFSTDTFLISEMIDVGAYSKPIFFDYNNDNLLDIVVGIGNTYGKDLIVHRGLWLYKNIGTASLPAFELVNKNFGGLDEFPISQLAPAVADTDNDGDEDLYVGISDGTLVYLENLSGGAGEANFAAPQFNYQLIDIGQFATPFFIDIELDGKMDLIIGEQNGNLNYYHNTGTADTPIFTLESELWGGVDVRKPGFVTGYSAPFMYRNQNDSLYLLVGSQIGNVFQYNEIEDALLGEFYEADTNYLAYYHGFYASINGGDLNGDGEMELLSGTIRGGVQIFKLDNGTAIHQIENNQGIIISPNPVNDIIYLNLNNVTAENVVVNMYNITGALLYSKTINAATATITLNASFVPGIYFITATSKAFRVGTSFIKN